MRQRRHRGEKTAVVLHRIDTCDMRKHDCVLGNAELGSHRAPRRCIRLEFVDVDSVGDHLRAPRMISQRQMRLEAGGGIGRHQIGPSR
jgi:hypothetical protein